MTWLSCLARTQNWKLVSAAPDISKIVGNEEDDDKENDLGWALKPTWNTISGHLQLHDAN